MSKVERMMRSLGALPAALAEVREQIAAMREAIAALPEYPHEFQNAHPIDCPSDQPCVCGAAEPNEARSRARKAAGLKDI